MVETYRLWPFPLNWGNGFEINLELRTEVIQSGNGKEQRIANRETPRKNFRFSNRVRETKFRQFLNQMVAWQGRATIVPEFCSFARLAALASNGQAFVVVEEVPDWLVAGSLIVLMFDGEALYREVTAVVGTTINFTDVLVGDWPAGLKVLKGVKGRIANQLTGSQHTNNMMTVSVVFDADPGLETFPAVGSAAVTHRGREVLLKRPNWAGGLNPEFLSPQIILDYGTGRIEGFNPIVFNDRYHKASYLGRSLAEVEEAMDFFRRVGGQQTEFFMPTFTEDLHLKKTITAGSNQMRITGSETAEDLVSDTIYKDLIVYLDDGTYLMRTVSSISVIDDSEGKDTLIQVSAVFPNQIQPANVRQICWMPLWRLASDQITFSFVTDEVAQYAMTMKTLEYEAAE